MITFVIFHARTYTKCWFSVGLVLDKNATSRAIVESVGMLDVFEKLLQRKKTWQIFAVAVRS